MNEQHSAKNRQRVSNTMTGTSKVLGPGQNDKMTFALGPYVEKISIRNLVLHFLTSKTTPRRVFLKAVA